MSAQRYAVTMTMVGLAVAGLLWTPRARAQMLGEQSAAMSMNENLSGGSSESAGGGVAGLALQRARAVAPQANAANQTQMGGIAATGPGGAPQMGATMMPAGAPGAAMATADQLTQMTQMANGPKITVLTGSRIFDAISGELVDDVVKRKVPESEKDKYFDDGTHGDLTANDEVYTRVDGEVRDVISSANQKVKERLVQALRVASEYNPVEFYGYALMSTDRAQPLPRNEAWKVVKDPAGGVGMVLAERPVDRPMEVPKYRDKLKDKDQKVKDDWALRFLQEYRKKKDDLSSEFFSVYIPQPPLPPSVTPPAGWTPFADPAANQKAEAASNPMNPMYMQYGGGAQGGGGMMMGGEMGGGMGGGGMRPR